MARTTIRTGMRTGALVAVFAAGWIGGSLTTRTADAQLGELGKGAMERAGEQGGALGAASKLGTSITDIQENLDALQKNVDTLKGIQKLLRG